MLWNNSHDIQSGNHQRESQFLVCIYNVIGQAEIKNNVNNETDRIKQIQYTPPYYNP